MSTTPLSVCCLTGDDPALVTTALRVLRRVPDEILVAVDTPVDPAALELLRSSLAPRP